METSNIKKFEDICKLKRPLIKGIYSYGFEKPQEIQIKGIQAITTLKDCVIQEQSGKGKTAAFSIGLLQNINDNDGSIQTIVLSHVRELAEQTKMIIEAFAKFMEINVILCVGGKQCDFSIKYPGKAVILVGTPGKIIQVMLNKMIKVPNNIASLVIAEFDQMLTNRFEEDIGEICRYILKESQIILVSATVNEEIKKTYSKLLRENPIEILLDNDKITLDGIKQYYIKLLDQSQKFSTLLDLYEKFSVTQCIIFLNTKSSSEFLHSELSKLGHAVSIIHGNLQQSERDIIMGEFRSGAIRILISTDLLSRGIDSQHVSMVVNYELPYEKEQYIHRIGRCGRFGSKGMSITLIASNKDQSQLESIEQYYSTTVPELPENWTDGIV